MEHTINVPVATLPESLFGLKFHQVAIYHHRPEVATKLWGEMGYTNWHADTAVLTGMENGIKSTKRGFMMFNYDILPLELEYVVYDTETRHNADKRDGQPPFISHLSTVVESLDEDMYRLMVDHDMVPYHQFVTSEHTNPNVRGKKRFREAIYNTATLLGFDIKLIQRVPWDYEADV